MSQDLCGISNSITSGKDFFRGNKSQPRNNRIKKRNPKSRALDKLAVIPETGATHLESPIDFCLGNFFQSHMGI